MTKYKRMGILNAEQGILNVEVLDLRHYWAIKQLRRPYFIIQYSLFNILYSTGSGLWFLILLTNIEDP